MVLVEKASDLWSGKTCKANDYDKKPTEHLKKTMHDHLRVKAKWGPDIIQGKAE